MKRTATVIVAALCFAAAGSALGGPEKNKEEKKKDDFPKFEDVTKDMTVQKGFFTLYYDKKKDVLLGRIPKALLNEPFLLSVSVPKGPIFAGWMLGAEAVYWDRLDKKLVLMAADARYKKGKGSTVEDVIDRTYTDTIIKALDIKTEAPGGDPIVDLGQLLKSDLAGLSGAYGNRHFDKSLSRWSTHKAFPDNVELAVDGAYMGSGPASDGIIASLYLSVSRLPKNDYKPRQADDRIGYFLTAQKDWSTDHNAKTVFKRYIHRWDLQKQDPKAEESPVKNPIIFYIEKTVPVKFRRYVRAGILEWSAAFEKCGLLDAIQVRQQTEHNEFAELDPEDVRYNFFRWIVSGRAFARGPSHVNPFTGEILDADIVFDDSMVRFYVYEYGLMGPQAFNMFSDPVAEELFTTHPELRYRSYVETLTPRFARGLHLNDASSMVDPVKMLHRLQVSTSESPLSAFHAGGPPCEFAAGMVHQLAFDQLLSVQNGRHDLPEEFLGQVIREIVAHEVGHTLGLRHNFKGSTWRPLGEITAPSAGHRALTGSVMDYNPAEYAASKNEQGDFVSQNIGPYDFWAIEYGYRPFEPTEDYKSEQEMLKSITDRVAQAGLQYATDEDTSDFGPDPYTYRFDNGDDPVAYARYRMALATRLVNNLADRALEDGESYARLRRAFNIVTNEFAFAARIAARMVGGQVVHRDHKGDTDARDPFNILPAEKQREALAFLGQTLFSDTFYRFPPDLLNKLGAGRFWHWDSDQMDFQIEYNIHERALRMQSRILTILINPITVNRIHDAELKVPTGDDAFTVPELFETLTDTIWAELDDNPQAGGTTPAGARWTNRKPRVSSIRRNLQREYLRRLINILLKEPGRGLNADAYSIVRLNVKNLAEKLDAVLLKSRANLDTYTLAHFDEARHRIKKVLEAEFTDGASRARSSRSVRRFGLETGVER